MENEKRLIVANELAERVSGIGIHFVGLRNGQILAKEAMEKYRDAVLRTIYEAPTVDAVEVVRCKECKSWKCLREDRGLCKHPTFTLDDDTIDPLTEPDDFCSYGERKDNGQS